MSLYDSFAARPDGGRALARARLQRTVLRILDKAFELSGLDSQTALAKRLRFRRSAVNQVFRGDGNVRISTLAEYLYELGYEVDLKLVEAGELRRAAMEGRSAVPIVHQADLNIMVTPTAGATDWRTIAASRATYTVTKRGASIELSFSGPASVISEDTSDFTVLVGS